jgi:hypothetical protein
MQFLDRSLFVTEILCWMLFIMLGIFQMHYVSKAGSASILMCKWRKGSYSAGTVRRTVFFSCQSEEGPVPTHSHLKR